MLTMPADIHKPVMMNSTRGFDLVPAGVKVRVVKDTGGDVARYVGVSVLEGDHAGKVGEIRRGELVPAK